MNSTDSISAKVKEIVIGEKYFCPNNIKGKNISGIWADFSMSYLSIEIHPCDNSTDNVICKSKEEIKRKIWEDRLNFFIYHPKIQVNNSNYDNPINRVFTEDSYYLGDSNSQKIVVYNLEETCINTDIDLFQTETSKLCENEIIYNSQDFRSLDKDSPYFYKMKF